MFGRKVILCDETEITPENIVEVLQSALLSHTQNSYDCDRLYEYYKGNQPILNRVKEIRPEICNKIVENRANEIVSFKVGYLCGEPIQYVSRGTTEEVSDGIGKLNDSMLLCGKAAKDKELAEWMYICGAGYRMIIPNSVYINTEIIPKLQNRETDFMEDEAPFEVYTLDPRSTFVVYHSGLGEKPLMGVKYITKENRATVYSVYTRDAYYEIANDEPYGALTIKKSELRGFKEVPIVEYPLNSARLGAVEVVTPILDAINSIQSNRLDGIEQFIQSMLVLVNADIDDEAVRYIREAGLVKLKSMGDNKSSIEVIAEELDQQQTQTLVDYMYQTVLNIVGMPNRNGGKSTSDTGSAVVMRDGWEAAEARAKSDELMFKEAERKFVKMVLKIMRDTVGTTLRLADIETKFTRRNYENILAKAQVLVSMLASDKIDPKLAFTHCGMFSDPEDAAKMSAEHYAEVMSMVEKTAAPPQEGDNAAS